jgi:polar amino acid transport system substrate-binding protein
MRVGFANESPFAFLDRGKLTGEAPEVARSVLRAMGIDEVQGVLTEFGSLVPGLKARRFELIAAGMYVTPERCKEVLFSEPTYCVAEAMLVPKGNPRGLHAYKDLLADAALRLGVVRGTAEHGYAEKLGIAADRVLAFPDPVSAVEGLMSGRIDAFAGTALTVNRLTSKLGSGASVERAVPFEQPVIDGKTVRGCGAFAFRKEDTELRDAFNRRLHAFRGSAQHIELIRPFGFSASDLPPADVTTAALCRP